MAQAVGRGVFVTIAVPVAAVVAVLTTVLLALQVAVVVDRGGGDVGDAAAVEVAGIGVKVPAGGCVAVNVGWTGVLVAGAGVPVAHSYSVKVSWRPCDRPPVLHS